MSNNPEEFKNTSEQSIETSEVAHEQLEKTRLEQNSTPELSPRDADTLERTALHEALDKASKLESQAVEQKYGSHNAKTTRGNTISKSQKKASFKKQIKEVQTQLSPSSRVFSKIIHNSLVEKTSDIVGSTVARPNAILSGAVTAFIVTLGVYLVAKNIGYSLSGFETIAAFIIGWLIGIIYDYLRALITGSSS